MTTNFVPTEIFNQNRLTQKDYNQFYEAIKLTGERVRILYQTPLYSTFTNGEIITGILPFSYSKEIIFDSDFIIEQTGAVSDYEKVCDMENGEVNRKVHGWAVCGNEEERLRYKTVHSRSLLKRLRGLANLQIEVFNPRNVLPTINIERLTRDQVDFQQKKAELIAMYSYDVYKNYGKYILNGYIDLNLGIASLVENPHIRDNLFFKSL